MNMAQGPLHDRRKKKNSQTMKIYLIDHRSVAAGALSCAPHQQSVNHFFVRTFFVNPLCDSFPTLVAHWHPMIQCY